MAHYIQGLVARPSLLAGYASEHKMHAAAPLAGGLAFLPLEPEDPCSLMEEDPTVGYGDDPEAFVYLSGPLQSELKRWSHSGPIIYLETDYSGGPGTQGAALFADGKMIFAEYSASGVINTALAMIGVEPDGSAIDLFDTVGLGRYRSNHNWICFGKDPENPRPWYG